MGPARHPRTKASPARPLTRARSTPDDRRERPAAPCGAGLEAWRGSSIAMPGGLSVRRWPGRSGAAGSAASRGAKHRAAGIARRAFPWRQAKRAAPQARRREGLKPNGRDGKVGTGRSPKARRRMRRHAQAFQMLALNTGRGHCRARIFEVTAPRAERPGRGADRGYSFVSMSHHTARGKARPVMG
jgi:hypothetical protein